MNMVEGLLDGLFGGGKEKSSQLQVPPPPPLAPNLSDAEKAVRLREEEDEARRRKGRAATILTGETGAGTPTTAAKTLTGE